MSAHTPGPWTVVLDETSADYLSIFQDDGTGNGDHIKLVAGDPESEANLALIAAAPELLAAAIRSIALMEARGIGMGEHDLRVAVGKALGVSPTEVTALTKAKGGDA